jgi:hypothetical protein
MQKRFEHTERKTLINSSDICDVRRNNVFILRGCFESITNILPNVALLPALQIEIDRRIGEIKSQVVTPLFYFLTQEKYQSLLQRYPQVAALLNDE